MATRFFSVIFCISCINLYIQVDPSQKYEERRFLAYDETMQRERVMTEIEIGSEKEIYDILILHRQVSSHKGKSHLIQRTIDVLNKSPYMVKFFQLFHMGTS